MAYAKLAEAKNQIIRIAEEVNEPLILVGGIAVNQYVTTRNSEDIDIICSNEVAKRLIDSLYPSKDWNWTDENDDEYRPSFIIKHKIKSDYPTVKFGPKITERGMYEYIKSEDLETDTQDFRYNNRNYPNIKIPSLEMLCYMKVVSFLGRDNSKIDKISNDLKDIEDLCNRDCFRLGVFINLVRKNNLEDKIHNEFSIRLSLIGKNLDNCNFGIVAKLFHNCINNIPEQTQSEKKMLVAFDVDGTLIKGIRHSWTLLWNELGIDNSSQVKLKERFIKGSLSYLEWVKKDCKRLVENGFSRKHITKIVASGKCSLTKNLIPAVQKLKENGVIVVIISGGVDALLYELLPEAKELFDEILINQFIFNKDNKLEKISATEYDWDDRKKGVVGKNRGLERMCEKYSIPLENSVFVGDDLNDFKAMEVAGKKIYYCGEERKFINDQLPKGIHIIPGNDLMQVAKKILNKE